jgi:hypothetical protein
MKALNGKNRKNRIKTSGERSRRKEKKKDWREA